MTKLKRALLGLLAVFYVGSGILHFTRPENYIRIIPAYLPAHLALVLISGVAEITLGIAVFFPKTRRLAAWGIIALLVAVFPANLYMYQQAVETGGAAFDVAPTVLYWRLWMQGLFILWAYVFTRPEKSNAYPV